MLISNRDHTLRSPGHVNPTADRGIITPRQESPEQFQASSPLSQEQQMQALSRGRVPKASANWHQDGASQQVGEVTNGVADTLESSGELVQQGAGRNLPVRLVGEMANEAGGALGAFSGAWRGIHQISSGNPADTLEERAQAVSALADTASIVPGLRLATAPVSMGADMVEQTLAAGESGRAGRIGRTVGQLTGATVTGLGAVTAFAGGCVALGAGLAAAAPILGAAAVFGAAGFAIYAGSTWLSDALTPHHPPST